MSLHQCRLHLRELPTVQSVVTFTGETIGKSGNEEGKQKHDATTTARNMEQTNPDDNCVNPAKKNTFS